MLGLAGFDAHKKLILNVRIPVTINRQMSLKQSKKTQNKTKKPKNNPDVNDLEDSPVSPLSAQWPQAPKSFVDVSMLAKHSSEHNKQSIHEQILTPRQASQHPTHKVVLSNVVRY